MVRPLSELVRTIAHPGELVWIGLRPARREPLQSVDHATVTTDGLQGDHISKGRDISGKRAITLIQQEHLAVIGAFLRQPAIEPARLRRNLVIKGINLIALKKRIIRIGTVTLAITGPCAPCSRMEEELGTGGYSAVRGHGGVTAKVVEPGTIKLGDVISPASEHTM